MVRLVSDTDRACQRPKLLFYLVSENIFMSCKVVLWVILDVKPLHKFGLLPTWPIILQFDIHIAIMLIMAIIYECTLVYFLCEYSLWVNNAQILWWPRNIILLILEKNGTYTFNPGILLDNIKSINFKKFRNDFYISL